MPNFLITGGTGVVGSALTSYLVRQGHRVIILTRNPQAGSSSNVIKPCHWDPYKGQIDAASLAETDYVVHLAGANVAEKRWTIKRKQEILESRVRSGELLAQALKQIPNKVKAVLGASAQGWYGPDPSIPNPRPFVESDPFYEDFLGTTCHQWEQSLQSIPSLGIRLIQLRIGIVLSRQGGALPEFYKPVRFGISPVLGRGDQVISWIHVQDLIQMIEWTLLHDSIKGVFNASAPNPVSNKVLMRALATATHRPFLPISVPAFVLKAVLGEMSIEVLKSTTMNVDKIQQAGFKFEYPTIETALSDLMRRSN